MNMVDGSKIVRICVFQINTTIVNNAHIFLLRLSFLSKLYGFFMSNLKQFSTGPKDPEKRSKYRGINFNFVIR